ncbi:MAG: phosphohistidine phosphatase SixA [Thermosynechococcaceae cyanobacterium]
MPMQVYFIRHGIAADPEGYVNDGDRPLTEKGRRKTQALAQRLNQLNLRFDDLLTSPLLRARQTAEILLQAGLAPQLRVTEVLAPMGSFHHWLDGLDRHKQAGHQAIALVGHEPDLSQWSELLLWGEARGVLELKKAGIIGIALPDTLDPVGNSILFWLTPPRFLILS